MSMKGHPPDDAPEGFQDSPVAWIVQFMLATDQRDPERAAKAKAELARLGWTFRYRKPRPEADGPGVTR